MYKFDLAISYKWIYDVDFVEQIESIFSKHGISTFIIHKKNVFEITNLVKNKDISFKAYLDRGSDEDEDFEELAQLLKNSRTYIINHYDNIKNAVDKSIMHIRLKGTGILTPETIIVEPFDKRKKSGLTNNDIQKLGIPFIIKPAYYSGGGDGVITNAGLIEEVEKERLKNCDDSYLVQKKIYPKIIEGHRAWIRTLWAFGKAVHLVWNDNTHVYAENSQKILKHLDIKKLDSIMHNLAEITGLDYFSSEIAVDKENNYYLIDYINDQCDMRLKSKHFDGVPDEVVEYFILRMAELVNSI
ncbi:MAG: hypothetical protein KJ571_13870 [Bacteroidetes bacterium]|nr:hypothetical protein [Bacteroidota bacterium]